MRLMLIGTDRALCSPASAVAARFARMGQRFPGDSFESVVFSTRAHGIKSPCLITANVSAHPTNSRSRLLYIVDALRLAKTLPRPDIVSAQDPFETGLAAYFIARRFKVPLMVEIHTDILSPQFKRASLLNRVRVLIAGFVLRRASGGYAVSSRVREEVVKRYTLSAPFEVFPIFVDTAKFAALPRAPGRGSLLWVGRFTHEKNPMRALEALARARAAGHGAHLTMLGQGPLEGRLRLLAKELGVEAHVTFAGWRDPAAFLPHTELLLVTSRYEGYGMALVEALAAGVPVLSTDVGVAREAGAVIADGDFKASLIQWLEGPRARGTLRLTTYTSESDYFDRVRNFYASHV
jgi:glycosyltransferase involved in cell wall biosynthesis